MRERRLTERQVSTLTGVPQRTINGIKHGAIPRFDTIELLAAGLNVTINDVIESEYYKK